MGELSCHWFGTKTIAKLFRQLARGEDAAAGTSSEVGKLAFDGHVAFGESRDIALDCDATGEGIPGQGSPGQGIPGQGIPGEGIPGQGIPGDGVMAAAVPGRPPRATLAAAPPPTAAPPPLRVMPSDPTAGRDPTAADPAGWDPTVGQDPTAGLDPTAGRGGHLRNWEHVITAARVLLSSSASTSTPARRRRSSSDLLPLLRLGSKIGEVKQV